MLALLANVHQQHGATPQAEAHYAAAIDLLEAAGAEAEGLGSAPTVEQLMKKLVSIGGEGALQRTRQKKSADEVTPTGSRDAGSPCMAGEVGGWGERVARSNGRNHDRLGCVL